MKRFYFFVIFLACPLIVFGQFKVNSTGDAYATKNMYISNYGLSTTYSAIVLKVNGDLAGYTGAFGVSRVSYGYGALPSSTSSYNTAIGYYALYSNTTGTSNTAIGHYALYSNTTGTRNTASGSYTLYSNTTGAYNTANGYYALRNSNGAYNTANGYYALYNNISGSDNTAFGSYALYSNISGSHNAAVGESALLNNTSGNYNTAIGANSLLSNFTGYYNTSVGCFSNQIATYTNLSNSTAIGSGAMNTASNQVRIGDNAVSSIGGKVGWSTTSDKRAKKNIRTEVPGLAFINLLQPVTYNLDLDAIDKIQKSDDPAITHLIDSLRMAQSPEEKRINAEARADKEKRVYTGFIAQDVEKAAQSIGYDFSGIDAPENEKSVYSLRYAEFVVPLVKAVQELSVQVQELIEQNNMLQEQVNKLTSGNAVVINENGSSNNFSFSMFPNPTSGLVTIDYTLYTDAPISIELYNMFGQRVKLITPQQNQKAGTYSVQTSVSNLVTGTYIVKVTSGNQVECKQLVIE